MACLHLLDPACAHVPVGVMKDCRRALCGSKVPLSCLMQLPPSEEETCHTCRRVRKLRYGQSVEGIEDLIRKLLGEGSGIPRRRWAQKNVAQALPEQVRTLEALGWVHTKGLPAEEGYVTIHATHELLRAAGLAEDLVRRVPHGRPACLGKAKAK